MVVIRLVIVLIGQFLLVVDATHGSVTGQRQFVFDKSLIRPAGSSSRRQLERSRSSRGLAGSISYDDYNSYHSGGSDDYTHPRYVSDNDRSPIGGHRCYSCMSTQMGERQMWGALSRTFNRPLAFTDNCDEPFRNATRVPTRVCRTLCVTLKHAVVVMGERTDKYYFIRDCAKLLSKYGFRNATLRELDALGSGCLDRSVQSLFNMRTSSPMDFKVTACPCFGDRCNAGARPTPPIVNAAAATVVLLSMLTGRSTATAAATLLATAVAGVCRQLLLP